MLWTCQPGLVLSSTINSPMKPHQTPLTGNIPSLQSSSIIKGPSEDVKYLVQNIHKYVTDPPNVVVYKVDVQQNLCVMKETLVLFLNMTTITGQHRSRISPQVVESGQSIAPVRATGVLSAPVFCPLW